MSHDIFLKRPHRVGHKKMFTGHPRGHKLTRDNYCQTCNDQTEAGILQVAGLWFKFGGILAD